MKIFHFVSPKIQTKLIEKINFSFKFPLFLGTKEIKDNSYFQSNYYKNVFWHIPIKEETNKNLGALAYQLTFAQKGAKNFWVYIEDNPLKKNRIKRLIDIELNHKENEFVFFIKEDPESTFKRRVELLERVVERHKEK